MPGPWFNIKMLSYLYWTTVEIRHRRIIYLHNGNSYNGKTVSPNWMAFLDLRLTHRLPPIVDTVNILIYYVFPWCFMSVWLGENVGVSTPPPPPPPPLPRLVKTDTGTTSGDNKISKKYELWLQSCSVFFNTRSNYSFDWCTSMQITFNTNSIRFTGKLGMFRKLQL